MSLYLDIFTVTIILLSKFQHKFICLMNKSTIFLCRYSTACENCKFEEGNRYGLRDTSLGRQSPGLAQYC